MKAPASISTLTIVPASPPAPVKHLIPEDEKAFLDLIADLVVQDILKSKPVQVNEECNSLHPDIG